MTRVQWGEGNYLYTRGGQWIELHGDGTAFMGYQDRRVSNGTHESIVARFGETPDPNVSHDYGPQIDHVRFVLAQVEDIRSKTESLSVYFAVLGLVIDPLNDYIAEMESLQED